VTSGRPTHVRTVGQGALAWSGGCLGHAICNPLVAATLQQHPHRVVIVTVGFMRIVQLSIEALGFGKCRTIEARLGFRDRSNGKLQLMRAALGDEALSGALLITDSIDDAPMFAWCRRPLRAVWPGSVYLRALPIEVQSQ
jgi:hypothetical protein